MATQQSNSKFQMNVCLGTNYEQIRTEWRPYILQEVFKNTHEDEHGRYYHDANEVSVGAPMIMTDLHPK
jgi:hypothetical protein